MTLLLLVSYGPAAPPVPVEVAGAVFAGIPKVEFSGFADKDDLSVTINNNPNITFHDGSHLKYHDESLVIFHDPYGNPGAVKSIPIPNTEYFGHADL